MTTAGPTLVHRFASAFNARDLDGVIACFTPDATYHDLYYGHFAGHEGLRALFTRMWSEGDAHQWDVGLVVEDDAALMAEWTFTFIVAAAVPSGAGRTLRSTGMSVFEKAGGRCRAYREQFDRAAGLLAVGIPPATVAGIVARRPTVEVEIPAPAAP